MVESKDNKASAPKKRKVTQKTPEMIAREEINAIKQENLSGQQLRLARKLAAKHGIEPSSDLDAVRLLRHQGLDPFATPKMADTHTTEARIGTLEDQDRHLPAHRESTQVGEAGTISDSQRARAVMKIQRDLARRRKRRMAQLLARLFFFVTVPALIAGYYFYFVATPMYSVKSEFMVQSSDNPISPQTGSLFGGGGSIFGAEDSIGVQGFLTSPEAMVLLDNEQGFKASFQGDNIDAIQRMDKDVSNEIAYKTYKKKVLVGFDPTEGILRMEVIAPDPEQAMRFSSALLDFAETRVDEQTSRLREGQLDGALKLRDDAELNLRIAQQKVLELQERRGVFSGEAEVSVAMGQISSLESSLQERRLALAEVMNNTRPNQAKVNSLTNQINELQRTVDELRADMTVGSDANTSLARITSELAQAEAEVVLRQTLLAQSVQTLEAATIEASRKTKYLALNVRPITPQDAAYPRKFENTFLSFLVFAGIYLLISLTGSILREQVSN
jgi:capsular polysaccharide transport system permease protein